MSKSSRRFFFRTGTLALAGGVIGKHMVSGANFSPFPGRMVTGSDDAQYAEIIETKMICKETGKFPGEGSEYGTNHHGHPVIKKKIMERNRYLGWPTIAKLSNGDIMVAFSGDRDAHVCPWGKTQVITSRNDGGTWSEPITVNNTPLDDRDAGLIQTKKGTLIISWFTSLAFESPSFEAAKERYARHSEKLDAETREKWLGNWIRRSEDGGKTWLEPVRTVSSTPHGPILLRDGNLLYIGTGRLNQRKTITVEQSTDDGRSWNVISDLHDNNSFSNDLSEPHIIELAGGKLLALFRSEKGFLMQTESYDEGKNWTEIHNTGIWGFPPHLLQLKNGWLLVVYGHRRNPYGQKACVSRDEGNTWDTEHQIFLSGAPGPDLGYPSSVQLDDNSILTVYYQAEALGDPTVLMSTHWKVK